MGFYELGNGCDSCESVQMLPQNVNMNMDNSSSMVSGMMMPYNPISNPMKQYNGGVTAGYVSNGTNIGVTGNGSTGMTMGAAQPAAVKQVTTTVTTTNVPAAAATTGTGHTGATTKVEGFASGSTSTGMNSGVNGPKYWILSGLIYFCALAANECCKYFLNKSIQLDGSPLYYVAYVAISILLSYAVYTYFSSNSNSNSNSNTTSTSH